MQPPTITSISELPPREQLIACGANSLTTGGLLAVVLGSGGKGRPVALLADQILRETGGIAALSTASVAELCAIPGIGPAAATRIVACFQLGYRTWQEAAQGCTPVVVRGPEDIYSRLRGRLALLEQEVFMVLALDVRGRILDEIEVARGSLASVVVHPREVFRPLIRRAAYACVVAHNHPSGDSTPSTEDHELTDRLYKVGHLVGIELLDHVIIASSGYHSMADSLHNEHPVEMDEFADSCHWSWHR